MSSAWLRSHDGGVAVTLLAELLDAGDDRASVDDIAEHVGPMLGRSGPLAAMLGDSAIDHQLARLADLGLVTPVDGTRVTLTAAGRSIGAEIVTEAGVEVVFRANPATADADALVARCSCSTKTPPQPTSAPGRRPTRPAPAEVVAAATAGRPRPATYSGCWSSQGRCSGTDADGPRWPTGTARTRRS